MSHGHDSKIIPVERSIADDLLSVFTSRSLCPVRSHHAIIYVSSLLTLYLEILNSFFSSFLAPSSSHISLRFINTHPTPDAVRVRSTAAFTTTETNNNHNSRAAAAASTHRQTHIYYSLKQTSSFHLVWRQSGGFFYSSLFLQWRQANRIFVYIYKMHDFRHRYSFRVESFNWKHRKHYTQLCIFVHIHVPYVPPTKPNQLNKLKRQQFIVQTKLKIRKNRISRAFIRINHQNKHFEIWCVNLRVWTVPFVANQRSKKVLKKIERKKEASREKEKKRVQKRKRVSGSKRKANRQKWIIQSTDKNK